jgi:hypothetical protein
MPEGPRSRGFALVGVLLDIPDCSSRDVAIILALLFLGLDRFAIDRSPFWERLPPPTELESVKTHCATASAAWILPRPNRCRESLKCARL